MFFFLFSLYGFKLKKEFAVPLDEMFSQDLKKNDLKSFICRQENVTAVRSLLQL